MVIFMETCNHAKSSFSLIYDVLEKYGDVPGSLITVLQHAQEQYGFLSVEIMYYIAEKLGLPPAKVMGVATFYTQFRMKPIGEYLIMLCQGTACYVNGAKQIEEAICEELGIVDGETTEDGLFTLENVACLGCCSLSPAMMINGNVYGTLTPESAKKILNDLRQEARV